MAYPRARNLNSELVEGMSDGSFKKVIQNRGGEVELDTARTRDALADVWHGIHEMNPKALPDGTVANTPCYVPTKQAQISV